MSYEAGDIKVFNPNKEISKEITLEILIRHRDALKQARTGELIGIPIEKQKDNDRKMNQARALSLIIASQREMITVSRPIVYFTSFSKWTKKNKKSLEKILKNPSETETESEKIEAKLDEMDIEKPQDENEGFKTEVNDYNKLLSWLGFLKECETALINADKTKNKDDDFLIVRQDSSDGKEIHELTPNFYEMLDDLELSYEQIYLIMLVNKIVSAGIEEDDERTYKELEEEAIKRVTEA